MIGRDNVDMPGDQLVPERIGILARPQRGRALGDGARPLEFFDDLGVVIGVLEYRDAGDHISSPSASGSFCSDACTILPVPIRHG